MDPRDKKISSVWDDFKRNVSITDPFREQFPTTKRYSFHAKQEKAELTEFMLVLPKHTMLKI